MDIIITIINYKDNKIVTFITVLNINPKNSKDVKLE